MNKAKKGEVLKVHYTGKLTSVDEFDSSVGRSPLEPIPVGVTDIKGDVVVFDANHELAGKELVFDIELVDIG